MRNTYILILDFLMILGDGITSFIHTLINAFGVFVALVCLLVVEHHGVQMGLMQLEPQLAPFAALALVLANLILEFHVVGLDKNKTQKRYAFSVRRVLDTWNYRLGWLGKGKVWKPRLTSETQRVKGYQNYLMTTILLLTVSGRLQVQIDNAAGAWAQGLVQVVESSTLSQFTVWLTGIAFSVAAVWGAQLLANYVARQNQTLRRRVQRGNKKSASVINPNGNPKLEKISNSNGNFHQNSIGGMPGYSKRSNASELVKRHLENNPDDIHINSFELADRLGVGKSTVYNVRKELQNVV